ncbi:pyridoxal phosphate-dependent transferase [Chytriomyces cf. hyalinus JEL632]|nr:pyridoxal phosphate-dependent transferase [Chytriomyces cf. hyalinus JEL632]
MLQQQPLSDAWVPIDILDPFLRKEYATAFADSTDVRILGSATAMDGKRQTLLVESGNGSSYAVMLDQVQAGETEKQRAEAGLERLLALGNRNKAPVQSESGGLFASDTIQMQSGVFAVSMLSLGVGACLWADSPRTSDPALLHSLGYELAEMHAYMRHTIEAKPMADSAWDTLLYAMKSTQALLAEGCDKKSEAKKLVDVLKARNNTSLQATLNQLNASNILVSKAGKVVGFLGIETDAVHFTYSDLIAAVYTACVRKSNPLRTAASVIRGYNSSTKISPFLLAMLGSLIETQICIHLGSSDPQNTDAWDLFQKWQSLTPSIISSTFRNAAGLEPVHTSTQIQEWIQSNPATPILSPEFTHPGFTVLNMSMGSPLFDEPNDWIDISRFTHLCNESMAAAGPGVIGIGRYNEPRCIYYDSRYRRDGDEGSEWRTVHLGLDLFCPAGSKIVSPFPARVHSVIDNAEALDYGPTIFLQHTIPSTNNNEDIHFWTLYGHLDPECLTRLQVGQTLAAGDLVAHVGKPDRNGGWPEHLHFQVITDLLSDNGDFPGVAFPEEIDVWKSLSPDPTLFSGLSGVKGLSVFEDYRVQVAKMRDAQSASVGSLASSLGDLNIVRGFKQQVFDVMGRTLLDAFSPSTIVGHSHPVQSPFTVTKNQLKNFPFTPRQSAKAVKKQSSILTTTNPHNLHATTSELANALTCTLPKNLSICFFVNSGKEANQLALHLARAYTNSTALNTSKIEGGEMVGTIFIGSHEYTTLPAGTLKSQYDNVHASGGICIANEILTGLGRIGSHFWRFESQDVVPDIVTVGDALGNGHSIGAVITSPEIARAFNSDIENLVTVGGNPISCAASHRNINHFTQRKPPDKTAHRVGIHLIHRLQTLRQDFPSVITKIVGQGLTATATFSSETRFENCAAFVAKRLQDLGVLVGASDGNVLQIAPPLCFTLEDVGTLVEAFKKVLPEAVARF